MSTLGNYLDALPHDARMRVVLRPMYGYNCGNDLSMVGGPCLVEVARDFVEPLESADGPVVALAWRDPWLVVGHAYDELVKRVGQAHANYLVRTRAIRGMCTVSEPARTHRYVG